MVPIVDKRSRAQRLEALSAQYFEQMKGRGARTMMVLDALEMARWSR